MVRTVKNLFFVFKKIVIVLKDKIRELMSILFGFRYLELLGGRGFYV